MVQYRLPLLFLLLVCAVSYLPAQDFSVVVIPDPQNYNQFHPAIFKQQMQWIANNRTARNIKMVIGVGDMVNTASSAAQWQNADAAVDTLDRAAVPYAFAIGNHDYEGGKPAQRLATTFNRWFGFSRYAGYAWYKENLKGSNENFFVTFTGGGANYLVLLLEMHPRDSVITWASSVLNSHPSYRVIVVTHSFMNVDGTRVDQCDTNDLSAASGNDPDHLWTKFVSQHKNIFLVVSGHVVTKPASRRSDPGVNGNLVTQTLQNWQDAANGGDGWMRIYTFRPSLNRVDVTTYSPYRASRALTASLTDTQNQFSFPIVTSTSKASGTATLRGRIRQARLGGVNDCAPIAGAHVAIPGFSAVTTATGSFAISAPAPAIQTVTVTAPGHVSKSAEAQLNSGRATESEIFLSPN